MNKAKKSAYYFILLCGIISLFSDLTHEGARSILGPYLGLLGASAAVIAFVSGLGECIGYGRALSAALFAIKQKNFIPALVIEGKTGTCPADGNAPRQRPALTTGGKYNDYFKPYVLTALAICSAAYYKLTCTHAMDYDSRQLAGL